MKRSVFQCRFLSDVILNASAATEGNNRTINYIPGAALLGVAASNYDSFGADSYMVFHSGQVRFCDGHLFQQQRSIKIPAAFYVKKGEKLDSGCDVFVHHRIDEKLKDEWRSNGIQIKQQRDGYMIQNGNGYQMIKELKDFSIKSAYDRETRRAKDEKMFGYEYMSAGLEWEFYVDFEQDAEYLMEKVKISLEGRRKLGRSKSAQFGLVEIQHISDEDIKSYNDNIPEFMVFYAESCLAFINEYGLPTLTPTAADFGVEGEICWGKSQILTRTYAPWNQKRLTRDGDRICIDKGSVIIIHRTGAFDANLVLKGVGIYRNEGFGSVLVNPDFLNTDERGVSNIVFNNGVDPKNQFVSLSSEKIEIIENDPLIQFLKNMEGRVKSDNEILEAVRHFTDDKANSIIYKKIKPSQWGGIRERSSRADNLSHLRELLFGEKQGKDGIEFKKELGYLTHGIAAEDWRERRRLEKLKTWILDRGETAPQATIVLAAAMAKKASSKKK